MTRVNTSTNAPEAYINGAWSPIQSTQSGSFAGFRNVLINGSFAINQRGYASGSAVAAANTYTLDRWRIVVAGQSLTYSAYANGNQITAPAGGVEQLIEPSNMPGGVYTLSWVGTATATINGGAVVSGGQVTLIANTTPNVTFFGGTVAQAQLEPGYVATPFEQRTIGAELVLCQRYYEVGNFVYGAPYVRPSGINPGDPNCFATVQFKVTKRVTPSMGGVGYGSVTPAFIYIGPASGVGFLTANDPGFEASIGNWYANAEI
jgi:hypothetical protein